MEGFNGWARPLDRQVLSRGWRLFNVNNLKLARYKEIFPAPAKTDSIDTRCMLELFRLRTQLGVARDVLQEVAPVPAENDKLKRLTRRRRQSVIEKGRVLNRLRPICRRSVQVYWRSPQRRTTAGSSVAELPGGHR